MSKVSSNLIAEPSPARLVVAWYYAPHLAVLSVILGMLVYGAAARVAGWL